MNDDMTGEWTGAEIATAREALERSAALSVGRFMFSYAQLESALDLCLVWIDEGKHLDRYTRTIESLSIGGKLGMLQAHVHRQPSVQARTAYEGWLARAHGVRERRNVLAHGRLGLDVRRSSLTAVLSRATSTTLKSVEFRLADLDLLLDETKRLIHELNTLRGAHPLTS